MQSEANRINQCCFSQQKIILISKRSRKKNKKTQKRLNKSSEYSDKAHAVI